MPVQGIARAHYVAYEKGKTVHFPLTSDVDSDEWDDNVSEFPLETGV